MIVFVEGLLFRGRQASSSTARRHLRQACKFAFDGRSNSCFHFAGVRASADGSYRSRPFTSIIHHPRPFRARSASTLSTSWQQLSLRCLSTAPPSDTTNPSSTPKQIYVWEQTISSSAASASSDTTDSDGNGMKGGRGRILYRSVGDDGKNKTGGGWEVVTTPKRATNTDASTPSSRKNKDLIIIQNIPFIHHFLPAGYPHSVCPSYASYASYCFLGSVAGSSAMVLSTQALLVAVGVGTQSAAPMAAALNWVIKDGMGQLGGVIFASQLGKGGMDFDSLREKISTLTGSSGDREQKRGNFQRGTADTNPKRWRMVAALALDASTAMEICTPMMGPGWFLPAASIANVGKNVGFLAASASRAAIHQSLSMGGSSVLPTSGSSSNDATESTSSTGARNSNLGDVTAKAGSQAIVASLLGTAIGIFLSRTFCSDHGTAGILAGFVVLSAVHQVCTYRAVKVVPLRSLDRHRLHILLSSYISGKPAPLDIDSGLSQTVLTPAQVAEKESFLPMMRPDESSQWLSVGASLTSICPSGVDELKGLLLKKGVSVDVSSQQYEKYILKVHPSMPAAKGAGMVQLTFLQGATDDDLLRGMFHAYVAHSHSQSNQTMSEGTGIEIVSETHSFISSQMPTFVQQLREAGWQIGSGFVNVECGSSYRLKIEEDKANNS